MFQNYRQPILSLQYNMCRPAEEQSMKSNWHFCEIQWWECLQKQQWWWQCCLQPQARRVDRCRRPASSHPNPSTRSNRFPIAARRVSGCWCWRPLAAPSSPRPPSRRPKHEKHALYTWCNPTNKNHKLSARLPGRTELGWWSRSWWALEHVRGARCHPPQLWLTAVLAHVHATSSAHQSRPQLGTSAPRILTPDFGQRAETVANLCSYPTVYRKGD